MSDQEIPDITHDWLARAYSDLTLGSTALNTQGVLPEDACFHAQQCAEKALKGFLTRLSIPFPRTHAIEVLLDLLKTNGMIVPVSIDEAFILTEYAVQTRYPGDWEPVSDTEARHALELAARVYSWVKEIV